MITELYHWLSLVAMNCNFVFNPRKPIDLFIHYFLEGEVELSLKYLRKTPFLAVKKNYDKFQPSNSAIFINTLQAFEERNPYLAYNYMKSWHEKYPYVDYKEVFIWLYIVRKMHKFLKFKKSKSMKNAREYFKLVDSHELLYVHNTEIFSEIHMMHKLLPIYIKQFKTLNYRGFKMFAQSCFKIYSKCQFNDHVSIYTDSPLLTFNFTIDIKLSKREHDIVYAILKKCDDDAENGRISGLGVASTTYLTKARSLKDINNTYEYSPQDVHQIMKNVRKKLLSNGIEYDIFENIRSVGYRTLINPLLINI